MMNLVDNNMVNALQSVLSLHYKFGRNDALVMAARKVFSQYFARAAIGAPFEARGILLFGPSRSGKSKEFAEIVKDFNACGYPLPNGTTAKIVTCILDGRTTWKDLGAKTLDSMGYSYNRRATQREIQERLLYQSERQGIVGVVYDECQHIFPTKDTQAHAVILDSFKTMMKDRWPLMLFLLGVEELRTRVATHGQLDDLLAKVEFRYIDLGCDSDIRELNELCYAYCESIGLEFDHLANEDFYQRLVFASGAKWGLVIELLVAAICAAKTEGEDRVTLQDFSDAFTSQAGFERNFSPFLVEDYRRTFDMAKIIAMMKRPTD